VRQGTDCLPSYVLFIELVVGKGLEEKGTGGQCRRL
jgi:hypothetical protein